MKKIPFIPAEGVSNIELFYDLIFVYCISVITALMHHVHGGFFDLQTWAVFGFSYMVVLQVWLFTTLLMNRYGTYTASDYVCLFISMFLLYFLARGIRADWESSILIFHIAWALILLNLIVHWVFKRLRYNNLDADDKIIMNSTVVVLALQFVLVLVAAFVPPIPSAVISVIALVVGAGVFSQSRVFRRKSLRFAHLVERCTLLIIVAFGETIIAIATYLSEGVSLVYVAFVFALVVGLFLIYIYEHDNMTDHHRKTDGMGYMTVMAWVIFIIGNLAVALEYMPMEDIAFLPKNIFLTACLVLYLLTSLVFGIWNKPEFKFTKAFVIGRVLVCAFIILMAPVTHFSPLVTLICDTVAIYVALWHEWLLYRGRNAVRAVGHSLGISEGEEHARRAQADPPEGDDAQTSQ